MSVFITNEKWEYLRGKFTGEEVLELRKALEDDVTTPTVYSVDETKLNSPLKEKLLRLAHPSTFLSGVD